jgi:uncharacterized membrane protein YuzA (DUF378 family)
MSLSVKKTVAGLIKKFDSFNEILLVTGGVNIGIIGMFGIDVLHEIFFNNPTFLSTLYIWIGYAGIKKAFTIKFKN